MTPVIFSMIAVAAIFTAISNLALRYGIQKMGGFELSAAKFIPQILAFGTEPACLTGILGQFAAAVLWFRIVSVVDISRSYPILVSLTFLLIGFGANGVFAEDRLPAEFAWIRIELSVVVPKIRSVAVLIGTST